MAVFVFLFFFLVFIVLAVILYEKGINSAGKESEYPSSGGKLAGSFSSSGHSKKKY